MSHILRELQEKIESNFKINKPYGVILSGIVGCGKTTMVEKMIEGWSGQYDVFSFTGDSSQFRQAIREDSEYLYKQVIAQTSRVALIFIDEVQKCEEIFDAIKIAYDRGKISFIVSGSNPAYLATVARKRLQRRADFLTLSAISLRELIFHNQFYSPVAELNFEKILWTQTDLSKINFSPFRMSDQIIALCKQYFIYGGLPLSLIANDPEQKLMQIRLTVERGFELMSADNNSLADAIRSELSHLHSKEFAYKNIFEKTRTKKRNAINDVIDQLINHGYLIKKKPFLNDDQRTSYLSIFSYTDPGIVSYLTGDYDWERVAGSRVEGYIHERLAVFIANSPFKASLHYYKPYTVDANDKVKYQSGEVDFIFEHGKRIIPIEVKSSFGLSNMELNKIESFIKTHRSIFGIVIYGGAPHFDLKKNLLFWPYWLV